MPKQERFCVNFTIAKVMGKQAPIFKTEDLRESQHQFCELHAHASMGEVAAFTVNAQMKRGRV